MSDTQLIADQILQLGITARINGDYDRAIALLKRALAENPGHAQAHMELGLTYCFTGLFDESIEELQKAHALNAENPEICLHLAKTLTMLGMYEEGSCAFKTVLSLTKPGDKFHEEAAKQLAYFT